jgi:SAM-dependent methyltransferase
LNLLKQLWHKFNYSEPLLPLIDREPILDIGCGRGDLLLELSKRGYQTSGLEFNSEAVEDCLQKGLHVTQGSIETYAIPKDQYKCFVLSHALEHFLDPIAILTKLKEALPKDGKIVIAVPYAKSPMINLFGNYWHGWDPPFHITHFDKMTIRKVCEEAGLKPNTIQVKGNPEDFTRSLNLRTQRPQRYLILRALLLPLFGGMEWLGSGSYLLVSAVPKK